MFAHDSRTYSTLTLRILAYLARYGGPRHFRTIAEHVHATPTSTQNACVRMAHDGRLRWVSEGTYALRREG